MAEGSERTTCTFCVVIQISGRSRASSMGNAEKKVKPSHPINLTRQIRVVPLESSPVRQNELDLDEADALDPDSASRVGRAVGDRRVVRSSFT